VGRDHELRAAARRAHHDRDERERPGGRERRLGLVEHVEALAAEAVRRERQKRLAVRLLV
jgi:hypothetical protein